MKEYLDGGVFKTLKDSFIVCKRTTASGISRLGIVLAVDLEDYCFTHPSNAHIRSTEGVVLDRIPPRLKIRQDAPVELPHIMLLIDDRKHSVIEPIWSERASLEKVYDFDLNMGGGHLMTREGYDTDHLIDLLRRFRAKYPNLEVILEPGSAFTWRTGELVATVLDVVENQGVKTAIIDASFACHMPDCLEMPYKPAITEALAEPVHGKPTYRIGGNSCLSGDFIGDWSFDKPLAPGDVLTFEDMNHYTTVKTNMFNGIDHPSMVLLRSDGTVETLREFGYEDYRNRMD